VANRILRIAIVTLFLRPGDLEGGAPLDQGLDRRSVGMTQPPGVARPLTFHSGLLERVARIMAEMLRRSLETTPR
jgi:hypothetical protein